MELSIIGLGDGDSDLHRYDRQVNTIECPTKLVRQDAILGGLSISFDLKKIFHFWKELSNYD